MVIVPELAAVVGALLAAMFVYAVVIVAKGFAGLFPTDVPILSTIHRFFYNIALIGGAAVSWIMSDVIRPLIHAIIGPIQGFLRMLEGLANFASEAASSWVWLITKAIPGMVSKLLGRIASAIRAAETYAARILHTLAVAVSASIIRYYHLAIVAVHHLATAVLHDIALAKLYAHALVHTLAVDVAKDISLAYTKAVHYALAGDQALGRTIHALAGTVAGLEATSVKLVEDGVARAIQVSEAYSVAELSKAINLVDVEAAKAIAAVAPDIIVDVGKLVDVIGTDLPAIGAAARAIPRAIPGDLTGTLALVGALSVPMLRYLEQCGIPNCRNLAQYGRELRDLLNVLEDGSLIALLAMLCTDPEGAARFVTSELSGIIDEAVGAARDLMGVA